MEGSEATGLRLAAVGRGREDGRLGEITASGCDMVEVEALVSHSYESSSGKVSMSNEYEWVQS
jgi:hypothetical protein